MSFPREPSPCRLILGLLRRPTADREDVVTALAERFGEPEAATPEVPFTYSAYYDREMGPGLLRSFLAFGGLHHPGELSALKLETNALEQEWTGEGGRKVNLDPGLLNLTQVVLASGKPAAHRLYLASGIYAELEFLFERGSFRPLPWTYPDYREARVVAFLNAVREGHRTAQKESR